MSDFKKIFIIPIIFLAIGVFTLSDYGINWDEPTHFNRGQGYLHFLLTGNSEQNLPITSRPSFFNNHAFSYKALLTWDGGHPPVSDILASFFNLIFYQLLGIIGDIESYHLYEVFVATLAILVVSIFSYKIFGIFAAIVSAITLATYPLFFAESHFNIKDPPETAFISLTIFFFWMSLKKISWRWLLLSVIACGLGFGTKFNILFIPFILGPYILIRYFPIIKRGPKAILSGIGSIPRPFLLTFLFSPVVVISIFFVFWPFLWQDTLEHLVKVLFYYKEIGTGFDYQSNFLFNGFNLYPIFWIVITTYPLVLILTVIGIIFAIFKTDKEKTTILWLLWLLVPIIRVSLPNTAIYGGVRQIMEYIPAMALIAGVGSFYIMNFLEKTFKSKRVAIAAKVLILLLFLPLVFNLIRIHPNQNVYFNQLIGGLSGAKEKNIPSWGNSYGNPYWQMIEWLNSNAEQGSTFALVQGTGQNIAALKVRPDIIFSNTSWSGINRKGEYLMELTYQDSARAYPLVWNYLNKFLIPVYEVKVDRVAIAKIWKNDLQHTKQDYRKKELPKKDFKPSWQENNLLIDLGNNVLLSRLVLPFKKEGECTLTGKIFLSQDFKNWSIEPDDLGVEQLIPENSIGDGKNFYFAGQGARFIKINLDDNTCYLQDGSIDIYVLE